MENKRSLSVLEQAQRVALHAYALRFAPLGADHEGRVYFALTPSMAEREAAAALLAGDMTKGGKAQGRAIVSTDERRAMRRWGWFVAVWGKKPTEGLLPEDYDDDDDDVERWWGIWQPDELRRLADWIAIKNAIMEGKRVTTQDEGHEERAAPIPDGRKHLAASRSSSKSLKNSESQESRSGAWSGNLTPLSDVSDAEDEPGSDSTLSPVSEGESDEGSNEGDDGNVRMHVDDDARPVPSQAELKNLVKALIEYAEVLEWRVWRMEEEPRRDSKENGAVKDKDKTKTVGGRIGAISPVIFYGTAA